MKKCFLFISFSAFILLVNILCAQPNFDLYGAARLGDLASVQSALSRGADVNAKDSEDLTALRIAVINNYTDVARVLIKNGANIYAKDRIGYTALMIAEEEGFTDLVHVLKKPGRINLRRVR